VPDDLLDDWVRSVAAHTQPDRIHYCDGSDAERDALHAQMCADGTLRALNPQVYPRSFLHRSNPNDLLNAEHLTFVSTRERDAVGPTNRWMSREEADTRVWPAFKGAMKGRTMYVVIYLLGPVGSAWSRLGVTLTDSAWVVENLRLSTRMGSVRTRIGNLPLAGFSCKTSFVRGIHCRGDRTPEHRYNVYFPEQGTIWSIGSGDGGGALLNEKCHTLRIASAQARKEGWLAEHMLVLGVTDPQGLRYYIAATFPNASSKSQLAAITSGLPGWKIETLSDDVCWMHVGEDGGLWAINPEIGMSGVVAGNHAKSAPDATAALRRDVVFTNVALKADGTPWWEGKGLLADHEVLEDWRGQAWTSASSAPAAHPSAGFTVSLEQCPSASDSRDDPGGVPISAILFCGRRSEVVPLVYEARSWAHGVYVGASMVTETSAAASGNGAELTHDPMGMLPFCSYNMGDYFQHWLQLGAKLRHPPRIFHANWFRRDAAGRPLWPGFGENIRVLQWLLQRVQGTVDAEATPIGFVPRRGDLDVDGLDLSSEALDQLFEIEPGAWLHEAHRTLDFLAQFKTHLPSVLLREHQQLMTRLSRMLE